MAVPTSQWLEAQKWAHHAVAHVHGGHEHKAGALFWSESPLGCSSMFSGMVYPDRALQYLSAARKRVEPTLPEIAVTCRIQEGWAGPSLFQCSGIDNAYVCISSKYVRMHFDLSLCSFRNP